jgi:hypothetical protein
VGDVQGISVGDVQGISVGDTAGSPCRPG